MQQARAEVVEHVAVVVQGAGDRQRVRAVVERLRTEHRAGGDAARDAYRAEGVEAVVIAGESHGVTGAVQREASAPLYLDLHLPAGARFVQPIPPAHNAFLYVYRGEVGVAGTAVPAQRMAILANDPACDGVIIEAAGEARCLLIAGRPLAEPLAQYGPFVMNSEQEIYQALADFRDGCLAEG